MQFQFQTRRAQLVGASVVTIIFVAAVVWFLKSSRLGPGFLSYTFLPT